ncbi:MAG: carbon starvation protein A [Candidatus Omnitrophica bacterium]|nr:carbon starvation protein A [Candidatus Omnitrophota bacterium]
MINSLLLIIISLIIFGGGYFFYAQKLVRLWQIDHKNPTPAIFKYDGIDYIPAKNWLILFGHHFSSIAGAGPIVGPVIACLLWGWLPALLWIILGSVFMGGVHDFGSLIVSIRERGNSIPDISKEVVSRKAKIIFSLFVFLALILVIAVFAYLCADTFVKDPRVISPSLGLIPVAILVGFLLYNLKINSILVTVLGLISLYFLVQRGDLLAMYLGKSSLYIWLIVLFIYSYFASVLPVNILLQPRDYLSSFLLLAGMGFALIGVLISHPVIKIPFYIKWNTASGWLWPMLFVTVACGAISGFHALIASGTTSKQLSTEKYSCRIGYGAMLMEGLLAALVVVVVSSLNFNKDSLGLYLKERGPVEIFSQGYNRITFNILKGKGGFLAITVLNAFILTTLDTATRICRYIAEELFNIKNRFISTGIVLILSALLAFSGKWLKIWLTFGASNQLVASLVLFVISVWLIKKRKNIFFTLPIGLFMFFTTMGALIFQLISYLLNREYLLIFISLILIFLGSFMFWEIINSLIKIIKNRA